MKQRIIFLACFLGVISAGFVNVAAQTNAYQQTNLVSDVAGSARHTVPALQNPWGIAFNPGHPFWIANNGTGLATVYDETGNSVGPLAIGIPSHDGHSGSSPTGVVFNSFVQDGDFPVAGVPSQFLFATEDGTVSGWYVDARGDFPTAAAIAIDHSGAGAVYKGLAILAPPCCSKFLAVANFHSGLIETYTSGFALLAPPGSFTDPNLPAGYAPFNIQLIGSQVFITYALQDAAKHDPVVGTGNGIVDIFDQEGNFVRRFASNGPLNAPWGVAQASVNFGAFSNDILIGNFGDGTINAFDPTSGNFLGALKDGTGHTITNSSLWGLTFGAGGTGDADTLYFTAGLANEGHGLFGAIAASTSGTSPDFSVGASPQSTTVTAGQSANFMLTVTPASGFGGTVTFSCTAPTGVTCTFNPNTVTVGGANTTMLTATTSSSVMSYGQKAITATGMWLAGFGLLGYVFTGVEEKKKRLLAKIVGGVVCSLVAVSLLLTTACGGYKNNNQTNRGTASILVTATSGSLVHTTTLSLTVQ